MALSQIQNRTRGPSQEYLLLDYTPTLRGPEKGWYFR